jgi:hypothetical protein
MASSYFTLKFNLYIRKGVDASEILYLIVFPIAFT